MIGVDDVRFGEPAKPCSGQQDCSGSDAQDPHVCREGKCVALFDRRPETPADAGTPEDREGSCRRLIGAENLREDAPPPFLFGALSSPGEPEDHPAVLNYELAVRQLTGEGGIEIEGAQHVPVGVVCDVSSGVELDRTFDHLTRDLGIQAIVTPLHEAELERSFERLFWTQGRPVFLLSPGLSTQRLADIDDAGMLWHVLGPASDIAATYPPLIRRVTDYLHRLRPEGERPPLRLALLSSRRGEDLEIADSIASMLAQSTNTGDEFYRRYTLEDPELDDHRSYVSTSLALLSFRPHVIVAIDDDEFVYNLLRPLENGWAHIAGGQEQPFWVLSHHQQGSVALMRLLTQFPTLAERVVGVAPRVARGTLLYEAYVNQLRSENSRRDDVEGASNFFDASYFLLFAAAAAGDVERLSGASIAAGMPRLIEGEAFDMWSSQVQTALEALHDRSTSIALRGTFGLPDFDPATGARLYAEGSVWCVTLERNDRVSFHYDALKLDASKSAVIGSLGCFPGF
ncbi:MAG TPA: hypothetical protein VGK73_05000 [Polyangiaceae bacterium]